jgi:hypothetical protein
MSEVVAKLSAGRHPVEIVTRPGRTLEALRAALAREYVHVKFTATLGGTELGLRLEPERTDLSTADIEAGHGCLTLSGVLTLDYVPVRCVAVLQLPAMEGEGWLEPLAPQAA